MIKNLHTYFCKLISLIQKVNQKSDGIRVYPGLGFIAVAIIFSSCSSLRYRTAVTDYNEMAYADAIKNFEKIESTKKYPDVIFKLADCYRLTENSKALALYGTIMNNRNCLPIHRFYYAQELMKAGNYNEAKSWFNKYQLTSNAVEKNTDILIKACDSANVLYRDSELYIIKLLPFNASNVSSFAPAFYKNGIIFVSDRGGPGTKNFKSKWTGNRYYDLYSASKNEKGEWEIPLALKGSVNSLWNDGPAMVNSDNNVIYFTRNVTENNKLVKNKYDINELRIYKAVLENNEWRTVGELSYNNPDFSIFHPSINKDGTVMYFASDRPWGYGGTDIYQVKYINGRWSEAENLGSVLNTPGNEMFPFVVDDSLLYFSSDGQFGFGGMDNYVSKFDGEKWQTPINLGYPINTPSDDFSFIIDDTNKAGFFSSNRNSKPDQIYSFYKLPPKIIAKGIVSEFPGNRPLAGAKIFITDSAGWDTTFYSGTDGSFSQKLLLNKNFTIIISEKNHYTEAMQVSTIDKEKSEDIDLTTGMDAIVLNNPKANSKVSFEKKSTVFKRNAYKGLDDLAATLRLNPQINIEIAFYTDSRGSDKDNLDLTNARANICKDYLVKNGIDSGRIKAIGYGETKLLNHCKNGITCIDEEHEVNNRIEIKVTSIE